MSRELTGDIDAQVRIGSARADRAAARELGVTHRGWARFIRSRGVGWIVVVLLLLAWQIAGTIKPNPALPVPSKIITTLVQQFGPGGTLLPYMLETLRILAIGYVLSVVIGIVVGFTMGRVRVFWAFVEPVVELVRLTPATALIPLFILFLGLGDNMKITVLLCSATFPVLLNAYAGARNVSPTLRATAETFRLNWLQTQWEVALPAAIPFVLIGMRHALGVALTLALVTGMLVGNNGLGYFILNAQESLNTQRLLAGVFVVSLIGYGLNALFLLIERRFTRWRRTDDAA